MFAITPTYRKYSVVSESYEGSHSKNNYRMWEWGEVGQRAVINNFVIA